MQTTRRTTDNSKLLSSSSTSSKTSPEKNAKRILPNMTVEVKPSRPKRFALLAIFLGFLPWFGGGLFVTLTRSVLWLAVAGVLTTAASSIGAYLSRKSLDPVSVKQGLIVEPMLFACYYMVAAVLIRYMFLH